MGFFDNLRTARMQDGEKLYTFVSDVPFNLKLYYKPLSQGGKVEVIIFASLIAIREYINRHPFKDHDTARKLFYSHFFNEFKDVFRDNENVFLSFVNNRLGLYSVELNKMNNVGYLPSILLSTFYKCPLDYDYSYKDNDSLDLIELMKFTKALTFALKELEISTSKAIK